MFPFLFLEINKYTIKKRLTRLVLLTSQRKQNQKFVREFLEIGTTLNIPKCQHLTLNK